MKYIPLLVLALSLTACESSDGKLEQIAKKSPVSPTNTIELILDTVSPDAAVKSWWQVRDLSLTHDYDHCKTLDTKTPRHLEMDGFYAKVTDGIVLKRLTVSTYVCRKESFSREILNVKMESETRAVVLAQIKNTTPLLPNSVLEDIQKIERFEGSKYKYVVERKNNIWKISGISEVAKGVEIPKYDDFEYVSVPTSTFNGY
jgi:hypothetical protein